MDTSWFAVFAESRARPGYSASGDFIARLCAYRAPSFLRITRVACAGEDTVVRRRSECARKRERFLSAELHATYVPALIIAAERRRIRTSVKNFERKQLVPAETRQAARSDAERTNDALRDEASSCSPPRRHEREKETRVMFRNVERRKIRTKEENATRASVVLCVAIFAWSRANGTRISHLFIRIFFRTAHLRSAKYETP